MNRVAFLLLFSIYIAVTANVYTIKASIGYNWFDQWFFDKFFVFQFMSIVILGLIIEGKQYHYLSYVRIANRRGILRNQLIRYYGQAFIYINIMFLFIISGGYLLHLLNESESVMKIIDWYLRYFLGLIIFINVMLCLHWSNHQILSRYCTFIVFVWLSIEQIFLNPYIKKFFSLDINFLFSWIFHKSAVSYLVMVLWVSITLLLSSRLSDKRDFL